MRNAILGNNLKDLERWKLYASFFLREPTGNWPKLLVARWRGLVAKDKCLFFWFLACHATIAASPLISQQNEKSNLSGTQGIITLIYSKAQNLAFQQNVSLKV